MSGSADQIPRLHILLAEDRLTDAALPVAVRLYGGGDPVALHVRARLSAARLFEAADRLADEARSSGGWLVVNGRPDIALAARADAVQLGHAALTAGDVKPLAAATDLAIGVSVHGPVEAVAAVRDGADFLVVGTMYPTRSHPGRAGQGAAGIARVAEALDRVGVAAVPLLGIGGIDVDRFDELLAAGAHGVVVGRAVWGAPRPLERAARMAAALADAAG